VAEKRRAEDAAKHAVALAWHTANLVGLKINGGKLPPLEQMLQSTTQKRSGMSLRQQLEVVSKITGLPMVVHG